MESAILLIIVLIISVILHETAHGFAAEALGDPTARLAGRLTMNPLVHIDPLGSIILPALFVLSGSPVVFGWAKPVPFNPNNITGSRWKEKYGGALVAAAGPVVNIILAIIFGILIRTGLFSPELISFFFTVVIVNCALAIFNLIPIPPLDGHHILASVLPYQLRQKYLSLYQYSFILIFIAAFVLWQLVSPLVITLVRLITGL
jgi:Zn-dependent protease